MELICLSENSSIFCSKNEAWAKTAVGELDDTWSWLLMVYRRSDSVQSKIGQWAEDLSSSVLGAREINGMVLDGWSSDGGPFGVRTSVSAGGGVHGWHGVDSGASGM